ncbi:MAG: hypothetical protein OXI55_11145, partial [Gammaproteobacteria bacterium]|nr:hypothetical protein [Gammaproteobacteria bacterium]
SVVMFSMGVAVDVLVEMLFFVGVFVEMLSMGVTVDVLVEVLFFMAVFAVMLSMGVAVSKASASEVIDQKPCA